MPVWQKSNHVCESMCGCAWSTEVRMNFAKQACWKHFHEQLQTSLWPMYSDSGESLCQNTMSQWGGIYLACVDGGIHFFFFQPSGWMKKYNSFMASFSLSFKITFSWGSLTSWFWLISIPDWVLSLIYFFPGFRKKMFFLSVSTPRALQVWLLSVSKLPLNIFYFLL